MENEGLERDAPRDVLADLAQRVTLGAIVLCAGASGTGKSKAAQILAGHLRRGLQRIE